MPTAIAQLNVAYATQTGLPLGIRYPHPVNVYVWGQWVLVPGLANQYPNCGNTGGQPATPSQLIAWANGKSNTPPA